jgi:hypothetical protein
MKSIRYYERILEALTPLNIRPMKMYRGEDIAQFEKIETDMMTQYLRCFEADKVDRIITLKSDIMGGKLIVWATNIIPADEYPLPIFTSEIVQAVNHLSLRVDLIPLADCGRDLAYLEKYMVPMEEVWEKYKDVVGIDRERYVWLKVMLSPFYAYGKFKYDQWEGIDEKSLEITVEYLKLYTRFWSATERADPGYMEALNSRKRAMLKTLRENDPGEGPLKKALGEERAHQILSLLF